MPRKTTKPEQPSLGPPCCGECSFCHPNEQNQIRCWVGPAIYIGDDVNGDALFIRSTPCDVRHPACEKFDSTLKSN